MSTDNQQTKTTIDSQHEQYAAELREINDRLDRIAQSLGGTVDDILRDEQHINETIAAVLDKETGEITEEEFRKQVFPKGGRR